MRLPGALFGDMAFIPHDSAKQAEPDSVFPLHYFDNSAMFTNITMYAIMVFDEVLDPDKLRMSLDQLVRRETWQKLGARVRKGVCLPNIWVLQNCYERFLTSDRKMDLIYICRRSSPPAQLLPIHMYLTMWPKPTTLWHLTYPARIQRP